MIMNGKNGVSSIAVTMMMVMGPKGDEEEVGEQSRCQFRSEFGSGAELLSFPVQRRMRCLQRIRERTGDAVTERQSKKLQYSAMKCR